MTRKRIIWIWHLASCFYLLKALNDILLLVFLSFQGARKCEICCQYSKSANTIDTFYWVQLHMFQIKDVHDFFKIKSNVGSENVTKIYSCAVHFFLWALKFVVFINKFDNLLTQFNLFCCKEIWWKEVKLISSLMDLATKRNCVQSI